MNAAAQKLTQSNAILEFCKNLSPHIKLPAGVAIMNPFTDAVSWQLAEAFYRKFYNDHHIRAHSFSALIPGVSAAALRGFRLLIL
jgi:hypothetical protein